MGREPIQQLQKLQLVAQIVLKPKNYFIVMMKIGQGLVSGLEAGMHTVLVLTGSTSRDEAERFPYRPSRIVDSIASLVDELG